MRATIAAAMLASPLAVLGPDVAYSVTMCDLSYGKMSTSRVTLVCLRKGEEWRIIYSHFSTVPEE